MTRATHIELADAVTWLDREWEADLVLCDPPHFDTFTAWDDHARFAHAWVRAAFNALKPGGRLIHSCGAEVDELHNYMRAQSPDQILVWPHEPRHRDLRRFAPAHHFYLSYEKGEVEPLRWTADTWIPLEKPDPFYVQLITATVPVGALVLDPFCGRGEIPLAARVVQRQYAGCDINAAAVEYCKRTLEL